MATVTLSGFQEADALLGRLALEMRGKALAKAVRRGGGVAARDARRRVPRGPTGNLRRSISTRVKVYEGATVAVVGPRHDTGPHGHLVEEGHEKVLWGKRVGGRVVGKPFLAPAADETRSQQDAEIKKSLRDSVKQAGG